MNIEEQMNKASEILGLPIDKVKEQYTDIARQNDLDLMNDTDKTLCLGLFRQWFTGKRRALSGDSSDKSTANTGGGGSLVKTGFGVVIGVEECRDMMAWTRDQLTAQYVRSPDEVFEAGKVAVVTQTDTGHHVSQMKDGEEFSRDKDENWALPDSAIEIDDQWIIPLSDRPTWASGDKNKDYGKPLPKVQFLRRIHFIGQIPDGEVQRWTLQLKDALAQGFECELGRFVHIAGIWNEERNMMYGVRNQTNITYNDELDPNSDRYRDTSSMVLSELIEENFGNFMALLIDLERHHQDHESEPMSERLVVTDGTVTNMNMRPSEKTGSRTLFVQDLNAEFNYEDDEYSSTPCWVPPHLTIDFGIGSHVIVVGRTSQREMDGELSNVSINTFGVIVLDRRGNPVEFEGGESEDNEDWF